MRKLKHEEIPRLDPVEIASLPKHPISVVLNDIRSIYNVGSIFRTSDAARIEWLYLTGITGTPDHRALHKTALGAQDTVNWSYHKDPVELTENLRKKGYTIAVLEITDSPSKPESLDKSHFPLALILGNEVTGVHEDLVRMSDLALEIPQYGTKQSLNVSVAYGIAIYAILGRYHALFDTSSS